MSLQLSHVYWTVKYPSLTEEAPKEHEHRQQGSTGRRTGRNVARKETWDDVAQLDDSSRQAPRVPSQCPGGLHVGHSGTVISEELLET